MIKVFPDAKELNKFAAETFIKIGNSAIERRGRFALALAGGSTPKSLYRLLAGKNFKNKLDWKRVFFFFGDERNVSPDDERSNFRMANENLFAPLCENALNVFRWRTELGDARKTAEVYEQSIKRFFGLAENEFPRFDLILLGMGADGHTASLFPETEALRETEKIAAVNWVERLKEFRLTLTFPAINNAAVVIFLVTGAEKAKTFKEVLRGRFQPEKFPSQAVKLIKGDLIWLTDEKAAQFLA